MADNGWPNVSIEEDLIDLISEFSTDELSSFVELAPHFDVIAKTKGKNFQEINLSLIEHIESLYEKEVGGFTAALILAFAAISRID